MKMEHSVSSDQSEKKERSKEIVKKDAPLRENTKKLNGVQVLKVF
jgi:hypothetical protein